MRLSELIQDEVSEGWVLPLQGGIAEAQEKWPEGIAIGKLGLALSSFRPPCLVVDPTVSGVNPACVIPEKSTLPTARNLARCYPLRSSHYTLSGFSLDIKSAHKRIKIKESECGLLGFQFQGKLFFYRVCPFGGAFSARWWSRLGGFLLRFFHRLIWISHAGLLYVDDFIFIQNCKVISVTSAMLVIICQLCHIPISWRKCELGDSIQWIGWRISFVVGCLTLPLEKLDKLTALLSQLCSSDRTQRKFLE